MITFSNYKQVCSLEEAWTLNQKRSNLVLGGMAWIKMSRRRFGTAIDLSALGLDQITETDTAFEIGAMTSLRAMETHPGLHSYSDGAIRESLKHIVGVQFRNTATVGGSVFGRFGFSDVLTMLLAMDSAVELYKGGIVPMADFAAAKKDKDILVKVIVNKTPGHFAYRSVRNTRTDFPTLTCALAQMNGRMTAAVGARPQRAIKIEDPGYFDGGDFEKSAAAFADDVAQTIETGSNLRGSAAYRSHLASVLVKRCCMDIKALEGGR